MRPRWRSRGDGPDGCTPGPQRERRTAAAELVGSRGMTARGQGKKVGGAVAGQGRADARPAQKRGRIGGLSQQHRWRTTLTVGASSAWSALPVYHPPTVAAAMPPDTTTPFAARYGTGHVERDAVCKTVPIGASVRPPSLTWSDQAGPSSSESKDAISASGALNRPRLSFRRDDRLDRFQLFGRVHAKVDLRRADVGMTEPEGDLPDVVGGLQHDDRAAMPELMGRDAAIAQRCTSLGRRADMLVEHIFEARSGHRLALGVDEQFWHVNLAPDAQPRAKIARGLLPEWIPARSILS